MPTIKTQDLYRALITEPAGISASGDVDFSVSVPPRYTNGFLVLSPENAASRETVYFHNVIGNRIYVRGINRKSPKFHPVNDSIQMNDVEEIFNFYSDMNSQLFYIEKTGGLTVKVWGGSVLVNRSQVTIPDTNLTLTNNTTNYIVYDYITNVVSVNTTGVGLVKAVVPVVSGVIGEINYTVIKESYADPFVPDGSLVAPVIQNNTFAYAESTGSASNYAITLTPAPTAYVAGQKFFFKANHQNTTTATLNVNGLGAKTIKKLDGATDLVATDISNGAMVEVVYDGTNFQLTSIPNTINNPDVTKLTSITNLPLKTTPVGADELLISDSQASFVNKRIALNTFLSPFGDGSDGDVTISSNTTLIRDMYYRNLTISSTFVLNPNGYKIFVSETLTNNGFIRRNGNTGGTGNTGSFPAGGLAGAVLNQGSLNAEVAPGAGGSTGSKPGVAGSSSSPSYTNINGVSGGQSGNVYGSNQAGGSGGTSTRGSLYNVAYNSVQAICSLINPASFAPSTTQYKGPSGSGGGGTDWTPNSGSSGGGGGGNGGVIFICARTINNTSGTIESKGGNGGTGGSGGGGNGGGGGGGQGGVVILIYVTLTSIGTITLTGGTGGASGGGTATAGTTGNTGVTIQIPITV